MPFMETKVYFDGSHYIAIPHTTKPYKPRPKREEEVIEVEEGAISNEENVSNFPAENAVNATLPPSDEVEIVEETPFNADTGTPKPTKTRSMTRKQLFDELCQETVGMKKDVRKRAIVERMLPYFKSKTQAENYVNAQFWRRERNLICRRIRLTRKVNLQEFNFFCTFTYSDELHTEEEFKKKLQDTFKKMCYRRGWKYAGVWERGKEDRLHFHGLFYIPEGQMVGELVMVRDYSTKKHRMQERLQNTYFNERFGRSDFEPVEDRTALSDAIAYMAKYIGKTGGKIVYSKGLPQFFISDILDDDVICTTGAENNKLVLFDDFLCIDKGEIVGKVSKDTIAKMRKVN